MAPGRTTARVLLIVALAGVAALYTARLAYAPIYLVHDEVMFALHADSLARTGRALDGARLPVYFSDPWAEAGRDPLLIYATAAMLKILPLSEAAVRIPTGIVGVLGIVLTFFAARRLFHSERAALLSACALALAPAYFIHSRMALSVIYPVPFVLAWLWCLVAYVETDRVGVLAAGMFLLGAAVYSYLAAMLVIPVYLAVTAATLYLTGKPRRAYAVAAAAFAAALAALVYWQVAHPARYATLLSTYHLFDSNPAQHVEGVKRLGGLEGLTSRIQVYWSFFNPAFLFFGGDSSIVNSTRLVGVFVTPVAVFLAAGLYWIVQSRSTLRERILLCGLLTAPAGIVLMGALEIRRAMVFLPFAALVAGFGADRLLRAPQLGARAAAAALVAIAAVQFGLFVSDYFGQYRERSAYWFGGNLRGALVDVMSREPRGATSTVYLPASRGTEYWTFYARARHRDDLVSRAVVYTPDTLDARAVPAGSFVVDTADGTVAAELARTSSWVRVSEAREPNGTPAFAVFEKR